MNEITITTNKAAHVPGTSLGIWGWEIPVYLFLGGLAAGILVLSAYMILTERGKEFHLSTNRIVASVPVVMTLGMLALFLDLTHKVSVWRFYTTFRVTSVMSWGSWILLLVYPSSILLTLGTVRKGFPKVYKKLKAPPKSIPPWFPGLLERSVKFAEKQKKRIAAASLPIGVLLGIYTGVLLSSFGARPFWNSAIVGPLFLVSGLSTGAAFIILFSRNKKEKHFFTRLDLGFIGLELFILTLFIFGMLTSAGPHREAIGLILGGEFTHIFWIFIFAFGLSIPAFLEWLELKGWVIPGVYAAACVLAGGLLLRFIFLEVGQVSSWLSY